MLSPAIGQVLLRQSRRLLVTAAEVHGRKFDVVVCGAGIAGVSCAHYLSRVHGATVLLVDERPPLTLTSSLSTECYRTFFPGSPPLAAFMERSVDLLEARAAEASNGFGLNRRGYWFVSATEQGAAQHRLVAADLALVGGARVLRGGGHGLHYRPDTPFGAAAAAEAAAAGGGAAGGGAAGGGAAAALVFSGREAIGEYVSSLPPFLAPDATSLLVAPRAGWMNAQQMGMHLLSAARAAGTSTLVPASMVGIGIDARGAVCTAFLKVPGSPEPLGVACGAVVNAAGPFAAEVDDRMRRAAGGEWRAGGSRTDGEPSARGGEGEPGGFRRAGGSMVGGESFVARGGGGEDPVCTARGGLPLVNEVHAKAVLCDVRLAVPPDAPMVVWSDPISLPWSAEETAALCEMGPFEASLARELPGGFHLRPYPGAPGQPGHLLLLWEAIHADVTVQSPPPEVPELRGDLFAELVLRALSRAVPRLGSYLQPDGSMVAQISIDGGYYTKAPDNLPLIGPAVGAPRGAYLCAGLSGYGVMAANAAGELLAAHVAGAPLPVAYGKAFLPERWESTAYREGVESGAIGKGFQI